MKKQRRGNKEILAKEILAKKILTQSWKEIYIKSYQNSIESCYSFSENT